MLDLDAYLARVQWRDDLSPTHATLAALVRAHGRAIPFENLDVLLRRPVRLDLDALQDKLVRRCRGGYCFEHATLLGAVLEAVGFEITRHTARVVRFVPRSAAPRTHMFLTVRVAGDVFVVDPGFGGLAPQAPVLLADRRPPPAAATHWMVREGGEWMLRARSAAATFDCWVSTLECDNPVDFEVGNHYTATHASSSFVNRLMLRAITPDGSVSVLDRDVTHASGDATHTGRLADRAALRALLNAHFGFDLPETLSMQVPAIEEWR
jgi:N-hydroxyarylamine O-acetyltransferase